MYLQRKRGHTRPVLTVTDPVRVTRYVQFSITTIRQGYRLLTTLSASQEHRGNCKHGYQREPRAPKGLSVPPGLRTPLLPVVTVNL